MVTQEYKMVDDLDLTKMKIQKINELSIKEIRKEKFDKEDATHSLKAIFTTEEGYRYKLLAPKIKIQNFNICTETKIIESRVDNKIFMGTEYEVKQDINFLLNILKMNTYCRYQIIDITAYHLMSLKEIEKTLGFKIKLTSDKEGV